MTDYKKTIASAIATGAIFLNALAPVAHAGITIQITGNGSQTENDAQVEVENETSVTQTNYADVENNVDVDANTGDNEAEDNTGGDVSIETGDSDTTVNVTNTLNSNTANVNNACCLGDIDATISGNGTGSDQWLDLEVENKTDIDQYNKADVKNDIDVDQETGDNDAEDNTGGSVSIDTGDAKSNISVSTAANANSATVAGGEGGSLSAVISGNGSNSENDLELELENKNYLDQTNYADVENDIELDADTGDNDAEDNTGGEVVIETGDIDATVEVDNMVNFNWADVEGCGCLEDILAKVANNGTDSENEINAELESKTDADQYNDFDCAGHDACSDVDLDLDSGDNEAEDNTQGSEEDPSIDTGDADANVTVNNSGNVNAFGGEAPEVEVNLDLLELLSILDNLLGGLLD